MGEKVKERLLIVTEALEMNGVLRSLLDFMEAMDKERYEIYLFCFDAFQPEFVKLPSYVQLLPEDPWCYMARAPLARVVGWSMRHCVFYPLFRRLMVSLFQNRFPKWFCKQGLSRKARALNGEYDVACAYSMGMTWRFVDEQVKARKKLYWLDTDVRFEPWKSYWLNYSRHQAGGILVCVSDAIREMMMKRFSARIGSAVTIHNVVDDQCIRRRGMEALTLPRHDKFRIVTIGRYCTPKNQVMIPDIAAELRRRVVKDFEWIMAGPGAKKFRIEDPNLVYLDSIANPYPLMKSADLYVQPSTYEGWGLTVSEALCLGRYVIASDIPAFREQVRPLMDGLLVECTVTAFADAIQSFIDSPNPVEVDWAGRYGFAANRKEFELAINE